jgi:hypothetical protein
VSERAFAAVHNLRMTRRRRPHPRGRGHSAADFVLLQTTLPPYRDAFVQHLLERSPAAQVWVGDEYFDPTIKLSTYIAAVGGSTTGSFSADGLSGSVGRSPPLGCPPLLSWN